jgi:uncharacterized protein (TIGR03790 family)
MLVTIAVILCGTLPVWALEPNDVLVVANSNYAPSMQLARYYCQARGLPSGYVIPVALGNKPRDSISRTDYENRLAKPLRRLFSTRPDLAPIKCLVTTYGVPFKVGTRGPLEGAEKRLMELRQQLLAQEDLLARLEEKQQGDSADYRAAKRKKLLLEMDIGRVSGGETQASVDSELSLVLCGQYELYRWQPNLLSRSTASPLRTLMVCRLDGPSYEIARGLVDKAIAAEAEGLTGTAYIDSRGLFKKDAYGQYDQSLRDLAILTQLRSKLPVKEERTEKLFEPGSCPRAALYCGWYSLKRYVDAFEFVPGAVGFHIASFEATSLRSPSSAQWCPAMLRDGITATLGPVSEPYLHAFPKPQAFFGQLFEGRCLVEAFYRTKPFNSWQMVLIGDPLYTPFPRK